MHPEQGVDGNTALPYTAIMFEFIETPFFAKAVERYLDDDEYAELQAHLNKNPEAGVVVPGVRRGTQTAVGRSGPGQAWWFAHHLFCASRSGPHLDADYLRQKRHGEHPGIHAPRDEKGD